MNDKITMPRLAESLAIRTGLPRKLCEDFIRVFPDIVISALEQDGSVRIRDLGTFRLTGVMARRSVDVTTGEPIEIAEHSRISFTPTRELAKAVNAPFADFVSIPLPDGIDAGMLPESGIDDGCGPDGDTPSPVSPDTEPPAEPLSDTDAGDVLQHTGTDASDTVPLSAHVTDDPEASTDDGTLTVTVTVTDTENGTEKFSKTMKRKPHPRHQSSRRRAFLWGVLYGIALAVLISLAVWGIRRMFRPVSEPVTTVTEIIEIQPEEPVSDTAVTTDITPEAELEAVATLPTDGTDDLSRTLPCTDTITRTRYLTTMAKDYYGNFNLWPYIYEENKARLGHPDRIRPGTPVTVPPLSKYNVNPEDPEDIRRAKAKGAAIYARYR